MIVRSVLMKRLVNFPNAAIAKIGVLVVDRSWNFRHLDLPLLSMPNLNCLLFSMHQRLLHIMLKTKQLSNGTKFFCFLVSQWDQLLCSFVHFTPLYSFVENFSHKPFGVILVRGRFGHK